MERRTVGTGSEPPAPRAFETLDELVEGADPELFEPGEPIFRENEPASILFFLLEGRVDLELGRRFLRSIAAGELFGEESLDGETQRANTARAVIASRALPLSRALAARLVASDERFRFLLLRARLRDRGDGDIDLDRRTRR